MGSSSLYVSVILRLLKDDCFSYLTVHPCSLTDIIFTNKQQNKKLDPTNICYPPLFLSFSNKRITNLSIVFSFQDKMAPEKNLRKRLARLRKSPE
jgi:hypothetical protein